MYLNFSNFRGQTSAGGDKPWSKNGDKCRMGGIGKIFAGWGGPPSPPPRKKTLPVVTWQKRQNSSKISMDRLIKVDENVSYIKDKNLKLDRNSDVV